MSDAELRPGWAPASTDWRLVVDALGPDAEWFARQWELAGGQAPAVDTSWITTTKVRWA